MAKNSFEAEVAAAVEQAKKMRAALKQQKLQQLTDEDREHSNGRFRDGEADALTAIIDTVDENPSLFSNLAAHDGGDDAARLETGPARAALARRQTLAPLLAQLEALTALVNDDVLASGELVRELTTPAYAIIKANAPFNKSLKQSAAKAISFYRVNARKAAATRKKNAKQ